MEMMTEAVPQEEVKGRLTREEKMKLVEELSAFESGGGDIEEFAKMKGLSKWSLLKYRKKFGAKSGKNATKLAAFNDAEVLISGGWGIGDACKKTGLTYATWHYYKHRDEKKNPVVRKVKTLKLVDDPGFNKSLVARISALEALVVELSLDRQALIEAREVAI